MEPKPIDLYEFLVESELQHYYNAIKNELKICMVTHLKYASDEDLKQVGLSRPEIRRLRKFYEKYYPHGYFSKIKRLLQNPRKDDGLGNGAGGGMCGPGTNGMAASSPTGNDVSKSPNTPAKVPNNKHIIPADSIFVNKQLGTGEFGIVQQGVWTNGNERIQVAIKCLCRERMQSNPMEFLKEAAIMHSIEHENIVRLYGVVLDTDSLMLVTELAHLRSLLECLKDSGLRVSFLTVPTLCEFAMQICNGMMYLENKRLIHRDLAARNVLVFSKNKVKISDFGLSRALGVGKDYYQTNFNVNLKLPIAWCAPESINFLRFTNASDVWAYGVCLWEMFSYGFQPWAALTGHQILEAIDEPNYQRLEQPECCPKEYFALMLKCWQHDATKRPKFSDIYTMLPEMKPEQLKTVECCSEVKNKEYLLYRQGEIITVLDRNTNTPYWKGVLNSGKTGLFNPSNTVTYIGSLPSSTNKDTFTRTVDRSSKRKLRTEMISRPQNDLKHTGHVGLDGAYFGDVAFLSNSTQSSNHLPRQIVTPYKPSEDIEQTPLLLPPTPTSPDSLQTASGYFPENHSFAATAAANVIRSTSNDGFSSAFNFTNQSPINPSGFSASNPFANHLPDHGERGAFTNANLIDDTFKDARPKSVKWPEDNEECPHEYHEISDDEIPGDKVFDLGPSLLDEMDLMFRSMSNAEHAPKSPDVDHHNKKNEIAELTSKLHRKNSAGSSGTMGGPSKSSKKRGDCVKQISHKDEKILNQAIEIANEMSARSMTDLVSDSAPVAQSPKRKFSFRFPNLSHHNSNDRDHQSPAGSSSSTSTNTLNHPKERKNFSEELRNVSDLQNIITEKSLEAYNSLVEKSSSPTNTKFEYVRSKLEPSDHLSTGQRPVSAAAATLPRKFMVAPSSADLYKSKEFEFSVPHQSAPKPTTLPKNVSSGRSSKQHDMTDSNPLRILRDKNYPIVRPRVRVQSSLNDENTAPALDHADHSLDSEAMCESPSYISNSEFPCSENSASKQIDDNPIPLPPRDRNKVILTNPKRHVRKHPLIIPASGVQRTLNKVTTPVEEKNLQFPTGNNASNSKTFKTEKFELLSPSARSIEENHFYINQEDINMAQNDGKNYTKNVSEPSMADGQRLYENLQSLHLHLSDKPDTASLHFESILESDFNAVGGDMSSPDVVDGFNCFDIQKDVNSKQPFDTGEPLETLNMDIEKKKQEFVQKYPKYAQPQNELANNVLFNKVKQTVESAVSKNRQSRGMFDIDDEDLVLSEPRKHSNSASCEDLLAFAQTPHGRERGVESDEVRIMSKVLGKNVIAVDCISALEVVDWDVHKAIKICKLRNATSETHLSFDECVNVLQSYDWDLQATILKSHS